MTKHQEKILASLRDGATIRGFVSGWYFKNRLLRVETQLALEETGELVQFSPLGVLRGAGGSVICHSSHLELQLEKYNHQISGLKRIEA